jgi:hypothetical protein
MTTPEEDFDPTFADLTPEQMAENIIRQYEDLAGPEVAEKKGAAQDGNLEKGFISNWPPRYSVSDLEIRSIVQARMSSADTMRLPGFVRNDAVLRAQDGGVITWPARSLAGSLPWKVSMT